MSLLKSTVTVSGCTLISRILGYVRDIMMASALGAGMVADAFFVAFRLPNFFRQLSAEGALSNAFVPIFSGKIIENGPHAAIPFASAVLSWLVLILTITCIVMMYFMPEVMQLLAFGFADAPEKMAVAVTLGRIVFPYLLFISVVSLFSGMLQSMGKFIVGSLCPIILNIGMILGLWWFGSFGPTAAHILSYSVIVSGIFQVWLLWVFVSRSGLRLYFAPLKLTPDIRQLFRRMVPGVIGGGVTQLNLWINTIVATTIPGAVSYLYYADRIVQLPLALIGTALSVTLLPTLSKYIKTDQLTLAIDTKNRSIESAMLLVLPASVGAFMIAEPLIGAMFQRGAFTLQETLGTAAALQAYAVGLPAFVLVKLFLPSFFAVGDTKTPVKIALVCLLLNVTLSLLLVKPYGHVGLALTTSMASWLNFFLLVMVLSIKGRYHLERHVILSVSKTSIASVVMGVVLWLTCHKLVPLLQLQESYYSVTMLIGLLAIGGGVYVLTAWAVGMRPLILRLLRNEKHI